MIGTMLVITAIVALLWWQEIRELFQKSIIPYLREKCSDDVADAVADIICWIDDTKCMATRVVKKLWEKMKATLLSSVTQVYQTSGTEAAMKRTDYIRMPDNTVKRRIIEEVVPWENLPSGIREKFVKSNRKDATFDNVEALRDKMLERAKKDNMPLVLEMGV